MMRVFKDLYQYRELLAVLAWKNVIVRYKQAYLGLCWTIIKPLMLMLMFTIVRGFVGIDTGAVPYPILTFAALLPWTFFQEATTEGINSVVSNSTLIKKIYFPREILPLSSVSTKLIELGINLVILGGLMVYYRFIPTVQVFWIPLIIIYTVMFSLCVGFVGAAMNVYYRDVASALPILLSFGMYVSPVMYPLSLVKEKLLVKQALGPWSDLLYTLYTLNPIAGIIDSFQKTLLYGQPPDLLSLLPGLVLTIVVLPFSYVLFKKAESYFADVI